MIDRVLEFISKNGNSSSNNITTFEQNIFDNYYDFVSSLNDVLFGAIAHILLCLCIFVLYMEYTNSIFHIQFIIINFFLYKSIRIIILMTKILFM
jgi:hypothetical protein